MLKTIPFKLNNQKISLKTDAERTLLWVLRTDLGLTGPKYGCGEGLCGACTVLINNKAAQACQTTLNEIAGKEILTIEGLAHNGKLHPLQQAFIKHDALQCGFCTSGMILKAYSLLQENPRPSRKDIDEYMNGNLCRCGTYDRIIQAIQTAANEMKGG